MPSTPLHHYYINMPFKHLNFSLIRKINRFSTQVRRSTRHFMMEQRRHIALFQSPGMGHLIPIVEFAKQIISKHNISSTILVPTDTPISSSQMLFLEKLPHGIDYIVLPQVNLDADVISPVTRISLTLSRSIPSLRNALKSLVSTKRLVALVLDFFTTDGIDVAREFNVSSYIFWSSNAFSMAFLNYLPKLDELVTCEYRELSEPIQIPGCVPLYGKDFFDPVQDRKNNDYKCILHNAKRMKLADGIILNTFADLEGKTLRAVQSYHNVARVVQEAMPPLYPIGPLVQSNSYSDGTDTSGCLSWLDNQPRCSVVFVSFGSGGTLSSDQFTELAFGLEESKQRFIWVIRTPNDTSAYAAYFGDTNKDDPFTFLPKGFLERTKGCGLIVSSWAPQAAILGHAATGGFVTHCGWNSTLESIVNEVPLIAWPLYAEQKMNAVLITEGFKVAKRPKEDDNGLVKREEISNVVRNLMKGEEGQLIRDKMRHLQDASAMALSENGLSTKSLFELASHFQTGTLIDNTE